jgi:alkylation response protein AidB-like acyl-CoA dehydrogenase
MLQRPLFTAEHDLFREQVRRFFDREVTPHHARWEAEGIAR